MQEKKKLCRTKRTTLDILKGMTTIGIECARKVFAERPEMFPRLPEMLAEIDAELLRRKSECPTQKQR